MRLSQSNSTVVEPSQYGPPPQPLHPPPTNHPSPSNRLPHLPPTDPSTYPIPSTSTLLTLWDFGSPLPHRDVSAMLGNAERDVAFNIRARAPMKYQALNYASPNKKVRMLIHAKVDILTWEVVGMLVEGLRSWCNMWDYVEMDFNVGEAGREAEFGTGTIVGMR